MPLGRLLGPFKVVLKGVGPQQLEKTILVWGKTVFANAGLRYFETLDGPLGPAFQQPCARRSRMPQEPI